WRNSMRLVLRQEGENSPAWKRQVSLTQSMVQFYDACQTEEGRDQYSRFWPSMFKGIKGLLLSVEHDSDAFDQAVDPLELVCSAMVRGAVPDLKKAPVLESKSVVDQSFEVLPVDEKYLEQVEALQVGEWIRIKTPSGDYEACKLTVKTDDSEPWVFVNNTGNKIAKKNKFVLAKGVRDGVVELVGKGQWIDDLLRVSFNSLAKKLEADKQARQAAGPAAKPEKPKQTPRPEAGFDEKLSPPSPAELPVAAEADPADEQKERGDKASGISLVSMEEQASSHHVQDATYIERTDDILSGSTLSIVVEDDGLSSPAGDTVSGDPEWAEYVQEKTEITPAERDAATRAVRDMEVGALIDYVIEGKEERCKLAVKMETRNKYIFVNRVGVKIWDTNEQEVAEAVARGVVTIIDSGVKFDRALEQVVKNIQSDKRGREQ
ncbi:MAG: DUF1631 family protein, partial [Ketobacteraceae bacterium]|nr:DUF1631 family protein [Ketobacteraceae bacterium]